MALSHSSRIALNGLTLHLDAANSKCFKDGASSCTDLAFPNRQITTQNGVSFSTDAGGSFVFDGIDDYLTPSSVSVNNNENGPIMTVIGAIYPTTTATSILVCPDANGNDNWISTSTNRIYVLVTEFSDINNRGLFSTANSVPLNTWTHFAVTFYGLQVKIYINGSLNTTSNQTINIGSWNGIWQLGVRRSIPITAPWAGKIGFLSVYNRELLASEVKQNFNCFRKRYGY